MNFHTSRLKAGALAGALSCALALPALGQDDAKPTTVEDVRAEVSEAMEAVAEYSAQERDEALATVRETLDRLDTEIERREETLRENWADMDDAAKEAGREQLRSLRQARNVLGERYGALQESTSSAWDELMAGFANAWDAFSDLWETTDGESENN